jgi:PAS domain S-box-containing protein
LALSIPGILAQYLTEGWNSSVQRDLLLATAGIGSNIILYSLAKLHSSKTYLQILVRIFITIDIMLITFLIFIKGGIESRSPVLYTLPILVSAAIFGRRASYVTSLGCALAYIGLIVADYFNIIHSIGAFDPTLRQNLAYVIQSVCFFPSIFFVIALAADFITDLLTQKQQQASEHLNNLMTAQEIAKLGSWEWDIKQDKITWSPELYKLFGVHPHTINLKYDTYLRLIHPDDTKILNKKISQAFKNKQAFNADHRILMADGSLKYVHSEGRPLTDEHGTVIKMSGTAQDVTDMHNLDIAKRDFISLASHQLRTPASGVKAFLSLLLENHAGELNKKQRAFIAKANESNDRQLEIIDGLLSLASIQSGKIFLKKRPVDLRSLLRQSLSHYQPVRKVKRQRFILNKSRHPVIVNVDANHVQMAIDNLISNAIKYTPEKGKITITTRATKTSAYLEVVDNGIGIAKQDLPSLFQKFSRLNNPASHTVGGSGLGLYLAKAIIELHGGTITVRSEPGAGTQFRIKLPLSKPKQ